jgi:hypothetical protein
LTLVHFAIEYGAQVVCGAGRAGDDAIRWAKAIAWEVPAFNGDDSPGRITCEPCMTALRAALATEPGVPEGGAHDGMAHLLRCEQEDETGRCIRVASIHSHGLNVCAECYAVHRGDGRLPCPRCPELTPAPPPSRPSEVGDRTWQQERALVLRRLRDRADALAATQGDLAHAGRIMGSALRTEADRIERGDHIPGQAAGGDAKGESDGK